MSLFICPICQSPLKPATDTWHCDGSLSLKHSSKQAIHAFDVARQGYVNLLPVQHKKSKEPGDSQYSIDARRRFLQAGYYQPLQTAICEQIDKLRLQDNASSLHENQSTNWLDIGCGEGYYTQAIAQRGMSHVIAADISKPAIINLAKDSKAANYLWYQQGRTDHGVKTATIYPLVTSAAHLPLRANSMTGISSIFSPILPKAFAQVLQKDGYLIIAKPDVTHLASVREALFDEVREHDSDKFLVELEPYFRVIETHQVSTELSLSVSALSDLLTMTPYAYRAHIDRRHALLDRSQDKPFTTEAKFVIYVLQKKTDG